MVDLFLGKSSKRERNFIQMISNLLYNSEFVDKIAAATSLDAVTLSSIQAIDLYHEPKRADRITQEYIAYHILVTWYASVSQKQVEKLNKLREIFYAIGYSKDIDMYLAEYGFDLPKVKKGGNRKQSLTMGVAALSRQNSFSPSSQVSSGPNGENTVGKRILDANGDKNVQNCTKSGEEQLIAFGEATIENVGMGTDKTPRTVTFELQQTKSGISSSAAIPPPDSKFKYNDLTMIGTIYKIQKVQNTKEKQCHTCIAHVHCLLQMPRMLDLPLPGRGHIKQIHVWCAHCSANARVSVSMVLHC